MNTFLFDLDGTLGNTLPLCIAAFREAVEPLSGECLIDADIVANFGPSEEGTIAALLPGRENWNQELREDRATRVVNAVIACPVNT